MSTHKILVMGAGRIGVTVAVLLARTGDYTVFISDVANSYNLSELIGDSLQFISLDVRSPNEVIQFVKVNKIDGIVSCLPYNLTIEVAKIASFCGIDYFDPTEDVATTKLVCELANTTTNSFAPQCGLAPGFISIAANSLMKDFDDVENVKMRVGALTPNINNSLNYAFTWSIDGVINEYIKPCLAIENSELKLKPALSDLETLIVDNVHYEAFNTSGGVGSLVDSYLGKVKNMNYKTIRYPGHCSKMSFILNDLKLRDNPELVKEILTQVVPYTDDDKVVLSVAVQGKKNGKFCEMTYTKNLLPQIVDGNTYTAIQMATATGICTVIDIVIHEKQLSGLVKQEQIALESFLSNRFGCYYK